MPTRRNKEGLHTQSISGPHMHRIAKRLKTPTKQQNNNKRRKKHAGLSYTAPSAAVKTSYVVLTIGF